MNKYLKLICIDVILVTVFTGWFLYIGHCTKQMESGGYDTLGMIVPAITLLLTFIVVSIIHGIVTYKAFQKIVIPHLMYVVLYMVSWLILSIVDLIIKIPGLMGDTFYIFLLIYLCFSLIAALITKFIMYFIKKIKNQSPTDIIEQ